MFGYGPTDLLLVDVQVRILGVDLEKNILDVTMDPDLVKVSPVELKSPIPTNFSTKWDCSGVVFEHR